MRPSIRSVLRPCFPAPRAARTSLALAPLAGALIACALLGSGVAAQAPPPDLLKPSAINLPSAKPIVVADENGDGHLDLICFRGTVPPKLSVRLGDGLGGFLPEVQTDISPDKPEVLRGGDINHDGRTDVAYFVSQTSTVVVRFGASDGSFGPPLTLPLALSSVTTNVLLLDATGEGHLDLVASQTGTNRLTLYVGVGNGSFVTPPSQIIGPQFGHLVLGADFDGDGNTDLVLNSPFPVADNYVLFGNGGGSFDAPLLLPASTGLEAAAGDLDGDGRDEMGPVFAPDVGGYAVLGWNPETGFVTSKLQADFPGPESRGVAIGDIDRDGINELLISYYGDDRLRVYRPEGGEYALSVTYGAGRNPTDLHLADIDEDGGVDVVSHGDALTILAGQGDGELQTQQVLTAAARDLAVADLTGDGVPDVLTVFGAGHPAQMLRGRLGGGLGAPEPINVGPEPEQLWLLDATGDGQLDLLTTGGSTVAVTAGHGDGLFEPPLITLVDGDILHSVPAPFGGDGLPDLAVLLDNPGVNQPSYVHFLTNTGGGFADLQSTSVTPPGGHSSFFEAVDLDGDLDTDLLVSWGGYVRVFIHQPLGYEPAQLLDTSGYTQLVPADFDHDGDIDFAQRQGSALAVYSNDGTGAFASPVSYPASPVSGELHLADVNRDGWMDFALPASSGLGDVLLLLGQPGGGFGSPGYWTLGNRVDRLATGDMNGDGETDLVAVLDQTVVTIVDNGLGPWSKLGHSLAGQVGFSRLQGFGTLAPGSPVTLRISNGLPGALAFLIAGPNSIFAPFKGGVLVPQPLMITQLGVLDAQGHRELTGPWPAALPPGASFAMQVWRAESGAPNGFAATTAIRGTAP